MKKFVISCIVGSALVMGTVGGAFAAGDAPGTPGDANCRGQTTAYLAQLGKNLNIDGVRGIGGLSDVTGLSVQEIKAIVAAYCG